MNLKKEPVCGSNMLYYAIFTVAVDFFDVLGWESAKSRLSSFIKVL